MRDIRRAGSRVIGRRAEGIAQVQWNGERDEAGAVLLLALIFLLIGIIVVGALTNALTDDLGNSNTFKLTRTLQYAARDATEVAIQDIRYQPLLSTGQTLNASPPSYCWGSGPVSEFPISELTTPSVASIDGLSAMAVWCSTSWTPTSAATRVVTLSTCLYNPSDPTAAADCAARPLLQAVVTFDDYPSGLVSAPSPWPCYSANGATIGLYCGASATTNSWVWSPVVPTVTGIQPSSGSILGGTSVTITGTGFLPNATSVKFIEESGGTPASDNVVLPATVENVGSTSITVTSPAVTEGSTPYGITYFIAVTTPTGTSAYSTNIPDVFTYLPQSPTVSLTGLAPNTGSIAGGSSVAITGTGFFSGATVNFIEESSGAVVSGGKTLPATYVSVIGADSITAVSPGVTEGATYFVTVTTTINHETYSSCAPVSLACAPVFTYSPYYPIVSGLSPDAGRTGGGTSVTISGVNFFTGITVYFSPVGGGSNVTATSTLNGPNSITAISPAEGSPGGYYVWVSYTAGGTTYSSCVSGSVSAACAPVFTYDARPTVTSVSPSGGGYNGGTSVVVQGTGFLSATEVAFGGIAGTNLSITSDGLLTITSPAHSAGKVDVQVTNPAGTSNANPADDSFTYSALYTPTISVTNSPTSPTLGQGVTFTATVTGRSGGATPSGAITWNLSGQVTSCASITTLTGSGSPAGTATATCTITAAKAGGYSAYASVAADSNYTAAGPSSTDTFTVAMATPTIAVTNSPTSPTLGQSVIFTATVTGPSGGATPSGAVTWNLTGQATSCASTTPLSGSSNVATATCTITASTAGGYSAYASVAADSNYNAAGPSSTDSFITSSVFSGNSSTSTVFPGTHFSTSCTSTTCLYGSATSSAVMSTTSTANTYTFTTASTLTNLSVTLSASAGSQGGTATLTVILMKNGAATALSCSIASTATTCTSAGPVSFASGDTMNIETYRSSGGPSGTITGSWTINHT